MDNRYESVKKLIEENKGIVEFADFGEGINEEWIKKAESVLGIKLPPSYKWWLRNYGGGEICGEEIFSIYEEDFDSVIGGDIVYMHRLNQKNTLFNSNHLIICESDVDGVFYFDISSKSSEGEYVVFSSVTNQVYAEDFLEFLKKRIEILCK